MVTIGKYTETEISQWLPGAGHRGNQGMIANGYEFLSEEMTMLCNLVVMMIAQFCEYTKNHCIVQKKKKSSRNMTNYKKQ